MSRVGLIPGYNKIDPADNTDRFYQMYTIKKARIEFSNGSHVQADFDQDPKMKFFDVQDIKTTSVRIKILETYPPLPKSPRNEASNAPYEAFIAALGISEIKVEES